MTSEREQWFGRLRNLAEQMVKEQPKSAATANRTDMDRLINEIQVYQAELEIQNEELRRTQTEQEQSRDRFSRLYNMAPVGYIVLEQNGTILDANQTASEMLGKDRTDMLNRPFSQFIATDDQLRRRD